MKHVIYKITNSVNGKFYIGKHSTLDINDSYMGSGVAIKKAIKKYGKENFTKEILFEFENETDCLIKEAAIVTSEFINDPLTYNMTCGGKGSFAHIDNTGDKNPMKNEETRAKFRGDLNPSKRPEVRQKLKEKCSGKNNAMYGMCGVLSPRYGIAREDMVGNGNPAKSEEARKKISEFAKTRSGELAATFKGWICTPYGTYPSKSSASQALGITEYTLNKHIKDETKPDWYFQPKTT